jgi:glycosyltransferase involved in cell wall biosynthesis
MRRTVVSVAYPLAPVGPDAVGGAEQILDRLDRALVRSGHRSIVLACGGSRAHGELVTVQSAGGPFEPATIRVAQEEHARALRRILDRTRADVVHMHGVDFHTYLPPAGIPVLATLHLPIDRYPREALFPRRPDTWFQCVSARQHAACGDNPSVLPPIENGVAVGPFRPRRKRNFALSLARICPEKGIHLAIDAAKAAQIPLLIAGQVYPYPDHVRYFEREIVPRLDAQRRFIGPIGGARKRRLLEAARCLLAPSLAEETSSLVAREALAAATPVIARPAGALADTVEHGRTGFLVGGAAEMAEAIRRCDQIEPRHCWEAARTRFALAPMIAAYLNTYALLTRSTDTRTRNHGRIQNLAHRL